MKKNLILLFCATSLIAVSCKKKGCMDTLATNYSTEAEKDDATCTYESTLTLWYNQQAATGLASNGVSSLNLYVEGTLIATSDITVFWSAAPECGASSTMSSNQDLGLNKTSDFSWDVKDQNDASRFSGTWNAVGGTCDVVQLMN